MEKEKKKKGLIFSIIGVLFIGITISFAFWQIVLTQKNPNVVTTDCFKVTFTDGDAINIPNVYPMSDIEGMKNDSYDFTVTNVCNNRVLYQINLESLTPEGKRLPERYIKANLIEESNSKITTKLEDNLKVEPTINGADNAYKLLEGEIGANASKTFHLRLWMHSEVTGSDEESMNATYEGKISVIMSYTKPLQTVADTLKKIPVVTNGNGLYEVSHEDAEITYTTDVAAQTMLKETELRYAGINSDNYVRFNNELWRIIGLVNTPEGQRIKIIRDESIGEYSWDSSVSSVNLGFGANDWNTSKINNLLNNLYYSKGSGTCYNGQNNSTTPCNFEQIGIVDDFRDMIDEVSWNLGANGEKMTDSPLIFYNHERSNKTGKICESTEDYCNDSAIRSITWKGKIGLIYPSDYGYATSGESATNRATCLQTDFINWKNEDMKGCSSNNWLYKAQTSQWTITSCAALHQSRYVYGIFDTGAMQNYSAFGSYDIFPSLYLKPNVNLIDGLGTQDSPYLLSMNA